MSRWVRASTSVAIGLGLGVASSVIGSGAAAAAPAPVAIASCGDSRLELTPGTDGAAATLRGVIVTGASKWSFTATVGLARLGGKTRTLTVEDLRTQDRTPAARGKDASPSGLFIDLALDDKQVSLRHASEGGADPETSIDLKACSFDGDAAIAALQPPPVEPVGCAAAVVAGGYRTQVSRVAKLADADADREAKALCEDHQKTIAARSGAEQALSDRAARDRRTARGAALLRVEDNRIKAWSRLDECVGADPSKAKAVAALHDGEARLRACYARIGKP